MIRLNGTERELDAGATVADVVALLTETTAGCAVSINDEVVPRQEWADRRIVDGDRVEVLSAVQGG